MQYKIREYRKKNKLTQEELSKKAGVSRAILSRLETGAVTTTTTTTLIKLADALNVTVKDILLP